MRQVQHWINHFAMAINEVFFNIYETNMQFAPQIDIDRAIKLADWLKKFEGTILHTPMTAATQQQEINVRFKIMIDKVEPFKMQMALLSAQRAQNSLEVMVNVAALKNLVDNVILTAWHLVDFAASHSHQFDDIGHMVFSLHCLRTILEMECPLIHNLTVEIQDIQRFIMKFGILHLRVSQIINKLHNNYLTHTTPCFFTIVSEQNSQIRPKFGFKPKTKGR